MSHLSQEISLPLALANYLYAQAAYFGGSSVNAEFKAPVNGYMATLEPGKKYANASAVNTHELAEWIGASLDRTCKNEKVYFGSWIDHETGTYHFDISLNAKYLPNALTIAREHHQIAIWDVSNNCEIRLADLIS